MDQAAKTRVTWNVVANLTGRAAGSVMQLVQVPVFLHYWSVVSYGEWMVISAVPSYLTLSGLGLGTVATSDMTMQVAAGNSKENVLRIFQSCWWLLIALAVIGSCLLAVLLNFLPVARLLHLTQADPHDVNLSLLMLGVAVLVGQIEQMVGSAYTCVARNAYGSLVKTGISLLAFTAMLVPVMMGYGMVVVSGTFAVANCLGTLVVCLLVRRQIPWIRFGWRYASWSEVRRLLSPGVSFMGFPIGNAINLQGTLLVVGYVLGPSQIVAFGTTRTVSRIAYQFFQIVSLSFWPEFSRAFGAGDMALIRLMHRRACQLAVATSLTVVLCLAAVGPEFLSLWTGGHVMPDRGLLTLLLLAVAVSALWSTSSTIIVAINRHRDLSMIYIFVTAVTLFLAALVARQFGLLGVAVTLVVSELAMCAYVLPQSIKLTGDEARGFFTSLLVIPESMRLENLRDSIRRTLRLR